jgi:hypothetical protein
MVPVPKSQGISSGYLRAADGILEFTTGPGVDVGGINWLGELYRVMGTKLVKISSSVAITELATVASGTYARFDYSFDRLAIAVGGKLYYWDESTLTQVTDPDLLTVIDMLFVDGYFMTTDGEFLVVTELSDPTQVNPFKYGSSEVDPDPIVAIKKIRGEVYAINRHTIELFDNIGGDGFPFQRIEGAQITKGAVGTTACCVFLDTIAFLGSGRGEGGKGEALAVYLGMNGNVTKISTREIDQILKDYSEDVLSESILEPRFDQGHQLLYLHLPDQTLVYDAAATAAVKEPVWFKLTSGVEDTGQYLARNLVYAYGKWNCGHPQLSKLGQLTDSSSAHWGDKITWDFGTQIIYNESNGAIFHELELVTLTGRVPLNVDPQIWTDYSTDGETWSQRRYISAGTRGKRNEKLLWLSQGMMEKWRIQRFGGDSESFLSVARLEAQLEPLAF